MTCDIVKFRYFKVSGSVLAVDGPHGRRRAWSTATADRPEINGLFNDLMAVVRVADDDEVEASSP